MNSLSRNLRESKLKKQDGHVKELSYSCSISVGNLHFLIMNSLSRNLGESKLKKQDEHVKELSYSL